MTGYRPMPSTAHATDVELMLEVAGGSEEALAVLHRRFARLVFGLALQALDRAAAEDIVQDVFLAVWRNAATFDPQRGSVRAWVLQIAHFRVLNELRRRSRQPAIEADAEGELLASLPAQDPGPPEAAAAEQRRRVVGSAVDELPAPQRDAIRLHFTGDLTHEEVAAELGVPLGTAKTRIRTALQKLRASLAPQWAALAALCLLVALGVRYRSEHATLGRYDRALSMLTASDSVNLRLSALPGLPEDMHARYRGRPGVGMAVVTLSKFPAPSPGETYQAWARRGTTWISLGTARPDADGSARLIAEAPALATLPDAVTVTVEPRGGSSAPSGRVVVAWTE